MVSKSLKASIIIPARDANATLGQAVESVLKFAYRDDVEIIIVNDGLNKATAELATQYPAKVIDGNGGGIAAARNIGIQSSSGEIIILMDADCRAAPRWLESHLKVHRQYSGMLVVGGAFCIEANANLWARCDHYTSWYNAHPQLKEEWVPNHPGGNISFSRSTYERVGPFNEELPRSGVHEDIEWQVRLLRLGGRVRFQPQAAVWHADRDDFKGYLKHNYRWGYNSIEVKAGSRISRFPWVYEKPWALVVGLFPFAVGHTVYTIACWLKGGKLDPLFLSPFIFIGRLAYACGMATGGITFIKKKRKRWMPTKVVDVDIHQPDHIDGLEGYDAVEILFRAGREPLGRARIPCHGDSISPDQLQALIEELPPPSPLDPHEKTLPTITVAICTLNRIDELATALYSLAQQEFPPDEILVIDNGCQDEVRQLVENVHPSARYLPQRKRGLDFARNRALSEATCDVIAFLDDDAEADPFWVRSVVESFASFPRAGAVTGLVLPLELETPGQELFEAYGGFGRGFKRRVLPRESKRRFGLRVPLVAEAIGIGTGCNMALKTDVLKELHGFDEALDTGAPLPGGGDLDIFYRVMRAGYELVYEPRALVRHRHRRLDKKVRSQLVGYQGSLMAFLVKTLATERGWSRLEVALFLAWRLVKPGWRLVRSLAGGDDLPFTLFARSSLAAFAGLGGYHFSKWRIPRADG